MIPNSRYVYLQSLLLGAWPLPLKDLHVFNLSSPGPHTSAAWAPPSCTGGVYSARILNSRRTNDSDEWCYKFSGVSEPLLTAPEEDRQSKVRSARWQRGRSHVGDIPADIYECICWNIPIQYSYISRWCAASAHPNIPLIRMMTILLIKKKLCSLTLQGIFGKVKKKRSKSGKAQFSNIMIIHQVPETRKSHSNDARVLITHTTGTTYLIYHLLWKSTSAMTHSISATLMWTVYFRTSG